MADTAPPILTRLTFRSTFDLSTGPQPITFTASATDDASGVDHVNIWFAKPITYGYPNTTISSTLPLIALYDFDDSFSDGQSAYTYTLSSFNAPGSYAIDHVDVYDKANNEHTYSPAELAALGSLTSITILRSTPDTAPPN